MSVSSSVLRYPSLANKSSRKNRLYPQHSPISKSEANSLTIFLLASRDPWWIISTLYSYLKVIEYDYDKLVSFILTTMTKFLGKPIEKLDWSPFYGCFDIGLCLSNMYHLYPNTQDDCDYHSTSCSDGGPTT